MSDIDQRIAELQEQLRRYPPDRRPAEHATARFHLGSALIEESRPEEAADMLEAAATGFDRCQLPIEHAKALNLLGVAHRTMGGLETAADAFSTAAQLFAAHDRAGEQGAAEFNLGLVRRDEGDSDHAVSCFEQAWSRFAETGAVEQAAAAARELGTTLLSRGAPGDAIEPLERAVLLAERAGNAAATGAAANALGLARLATAQIEEAVAALETAIAADPRSVRPGGYAMAKANVALAHERADHPARARLAARQALGVPGAPGAVRTQARGVLERLGDDPSDLAVVMDQEPPERWPALLRDELARWVDADPDERRRHADAWIEGQLGRAGKGPELAQAWLEVALEQPPAAMETLIRGLLDALSEQSPDAAARFRSELSRATVRFPSPQMLRVEEALGRHWAELGQEGPWA